MAEVRAIFTLARFRKMVVSKGLPYALNQGGHKLRVANFAQHLLCQEFSQWLTKGLQADGCIFDKFIVDRWGRIRSQVVFREDRILVELYKWIGHTVVEVSLVTLTSNA